VSKRKRRDKKRYEEIRAAGRLGEIISK